MYEKLVVVTRKTRLQELVERFNTRAQAKFYLDRAGLDFAGYEEEDVTYRQALERLLGATPAGLKVQVLERALVPTYLFAATDVVVAIGQDGLVANTAKYVRDQPLLGVNPDPARLDGQLLPFSVEQARGALRRTLEGTARVREVTLAEARLSDGQRLLAFNDLFLGARTHVSARYRLKGPGQAGWEAQSSSGVLVSTGAGSTGWLSSVCTMATGMAAALGGQAGQALRLSWEDPRLYFVVREPFVSRHSSAGCVAGYVSREAPLELESLMPAGGVIFSDGMEADALQFTSGLTAKVGPSTQKARLVVG